MKKVFTSRKMRFIFLALTIMCLLGLSFVSLSSGGPSGANATTFQITSTSGALQGETPPAPDVPHEPDVTIGIILAGILLMVVILFGTLYATRGLRNPPRAH